MATIRILIIAAIMMSIVSSVGYAIQPPLPTSIYGVVTDTQGVPQPGVTIVAIWDTRQGTQKTQSAISLQQLQAQEKGDPSFEGYYFFTSGYINPPAGTEIRLIHDGVYVRSVYANPGELMGSYPIVIGAGSGQPAGPVDTGFGVATGTETGGSGSGGPLTPIPSTALPSSASDSALSPGEATESSVGAGSDAGSSESQSDGGQGGEYEGTGTEGTNTIGDLRAQSTGTETGGAPVDGDELSKYSDAELAFFSSEQSAGSVADSVTVDEVAFFGQLTDDNGNALEGKEITIEWTDDQGNVHNISATSLTSEEAENLGDPNLAGYYKFSKQQLNASVGNKLLIKVENDVVTQLFSSGDTREESFSVSLSSTRYSFAHIEPFLNFFRPYVSVLKPLFFLVGVIGLLLFFVVGGRRMQRKLSSPKHILHEDVSQLYYRKTRKIMTPPITMDEQSSLLDALEMMINESTNEVVTLSGQRLAGIVTDSGIVQSMMQDAKPSSTPLRDIHATPVCSVSAQKPALTVIDMMLDKNINRVVIVEKGKPIGMVTCKELLQLYEEFFSSHTIVTDTPAIVKSSYSPSIAKCTVHDTLDAVYNSMIAHQSNCAVVYQKNVVHGVIGNQAHGIITMRNLVEELYKNSKQAVNLRAQQVMETPLITIKTGFPLTDAMKLMLAKNFRQLPVQQGYQIRGVLEQHHVLAGISFMLKKFKPAEQPSLIKKVSTLFREGKRPSKEPKNGQTIHPKNA